MDQMEIEIVLHYYDWLELVVPINNSLYLENLWYFLVRKYLSIIISKPLNFLLNWNHLSLIFKYNFKSFV